MCAGAFAVGALPDVAGAGSVVGWFADTLPAFPAANSGTVDFVHVDGDLHSSAVTVLDLVGSRPAAGWVLASMLFDFPGREEREYRVLLRADETTAREIALRRSL
ncbi:class I SAM-dependent methyltransferase [Blastococcus saxobsidens]|uniref:Class I SAM-dependent methyltransferase n=1 Tax=Blastococcus saxobsidens TaxID=138336 RepID=A0A6L9W014_9ACTN|nr:class I SAM-dependent methyltransferase [Blastococcus saxobsidens]NEK85363.1 class I SAM-dependent methyltransferase [Blastococcus saxobsidens]